jgi:hypothetical protein
LSKMTLEWWLKQKWWTAGSKEFRQIKKGPIKTCSRGWWLRRRQFFCIVWWLCPCPHATEHWNTQGRRERKQANSERLT